jgi:DNA polymerase
MDRAADESSERIASLARAEEACRRCPLYRDATQAVPGEGRRGAKVMLVGEQPGDQEDKAGLPFVGPAGRMLDKALADAGIPRREAFVTNAVKHFKFEMRGKRRLHKRPNAYEIERCHKWYDFELDLVDPEVVVALGVSAVRAVLGRSGTITALRGKPHRLAGGRMAVVTVHPSLLLRIPDEASKIREYEAFVADLKRVSGLLRAQAA